MNINRFSLTPIVVLALIILVVFCLFGASIFNKDIFNISEVDKQSTQTQRAPALTATQAANVLIYAEQQATLDVIHITSMPAQMTLQAQNVAATQTRYDHIATIQARQAAATQLVDDQAMKIQAHHAAATQMVYNRIATDQAYQAAATQMVYDQKATDQGWELAATQIVDNQVATVQARQAAAIQMSYGQTATVQAQQITATQAAFDTERHQMQVRAETFAISALYYLLPFLTIAVIFVTWRVFNKIVVIRKVEVEAQLIDAHRQLCELRAKQRLSTKQIVAEKLQLPVQTHSELRVPIDQGNHFVLLDNEDGHKKSNQSWFG